MKIRKAYKYRLKTNLDQESKLFAITGCCRFVWNKMWALNKDRLEKKNGLLWYNEMAWLLTLWKKSEDYSFLKNAPSQSLQQTLKQLEKATKDGFNKNQPLKRIPNFKKKGFSDSYLYPQGFKIEGNRIFLPKLGWIGFRKSRVILGTPKNVTISRKGKHWFASIQVELELGTPIHSSSSAVGIDMGVKRFATLSDGTFSAPLNSFKSLETKLKREQRKLSRKKRFSANWKKQKEIITQIHSKIANARKDYIHKLSTTISKNHATVVLEDLTIRNMSKRTKGKGKKSKSSLNKAILDQGWFEFRRQLEYKLSWLGGKLVTIPPQYTSQTCPECSYVSKTNRKTQSLFSCDECGHTGNADHIASINILAAGHVATACGELVQLDLSVKQEPPLELALVV